MFSVSLDKSFKSDCKCQGKSVYYKWTLRVRINHNHYQTGDVYPPAPQNSSQISQGSPSCITGRRGLGQWSPVFRGDEHRVLFLTSSPSYSPRTDQPCCAGNHTLRDSLVEACKQGSISVRPTGSASIPVSSQGGM